MTKRQFKSESKRLLDLMINSIYTHKEIFMREIISNASDALDKMNYKLMTDTSSGISKDDLCIRISTDDEKRTITVSDNGIGMTAEELANNLGTIARSGTLEFKNALEDKNTSVIGQFGVGFYSSFMVSDKVTVISKAYGSDDAAVWESSGADGYTVKGCTKDGVGTDVIMHLKEDTETEDYSQYMESHRLQELVALYSDYIHWPIRMMVESGKWEETDELDEDGEQKGEYVTFEEEKTVNSMVPIWEKSKSDVSDEECNEFYKAKFHDYEDPLAIIRVDAEGSLSYKAMLFIPRRAPYDFYTKDFKPGLKLYSSNVLIMDKCEDLLPNCFRFVRGVVSSPDFSLNLSREVLQHDSQLRAVASNLKKKVKSELAKMMEERPDDYKVFYENFGRQIKYGVVEDYGMNAELLKDLLMFHSYKTETPISLDTYVKSMPSDQAKIYYVTSDTLDHARNLPQNEPVLDKGYDIICMTEEVDDFVMKALAEYDDKPLCNITSDDVGIESEEEKKEKDDVAAEHKDLLDFVKDVLKDDVSDVVISSKLKNHAVLLSSKGRVSLEMERYFNSFPGSDEEKMKAERVLELNASHPAFRSLSDAFSEDEEKATRLVKIMYGQACLISSMPIKDIAGYSDLVFGLF